MSPIPEFVVELRGLVGDIELWMPAITAVVRRDDEVLLVQRSDNGRWTPITGILDPGEEPAAAAVREALEETCVEIRVDRLASISSNHRVTHVNGDRAVYLDLTFACTWLSGEARVGDDESVAVRWCPVSELPEMPAYLRQRFDDVLAGEERTRFRL
ncbi:NUDIX domain-containing protein [Nocardioides sp. InS609-2]|uniref:NUDIX hydrolase n=1 Tax=Nocardioides sp. InS609-2 TaxID=2760705 RepID=UPI0020BED8CB|nr:NUDIX domain-containing protein [Nocardioides sp. InS609-2]